MGRQEQFSFDGIDTDTVSLEKSKKGVYISSLTVIIYVLVTITLTVAVGLIVHYVHPDTASSCSTEPLGVTSSALDTPITIETTLYDDDVWDMCINMSRMRNECLPGVSPCSKDRDEHVMYRLPPTFRPQHYIIEIRPDIYTGDPATFSYLGQVTMFILCTKSTHAIFVHFREMIIEKPINVSSDGIPVGVIEPMKEMHPIDILGIYLDREIQVGENISVTIRYYGLLAIDMVGMYYSDYQLNNETRYMLATQFEAIDARKAFPCLDEPSLKATFEITLWRKQPNIALSNMPLKNTQTKNDGWYADYFGTTAVPMPTYLVAFAIADYTYIENTTTGGLTKKRLRHWSRPDYIAQGFADYSLDVCMKMFDYFENYFGFPFQMPKEDQISIPDFESGAMENWGLITYQEGRMLYDQDHVTLYEKQRMTGTLAHELLHQWLGNVVTCGWWSDLWLNEGMARYHQHMAMKHAHPDWDVEQLFAAQVIYRAFASDQLGHSHPVHNPVNTSAGIEGMFNSITYDKGGCVIRMMHLLVLPNSYHSAMRKYVTRHAYKAVSFIDLLKAWDEQAVADNIRLESNMTVVMMTWLTQMGYPVVTMNRIGVVAVDITQKLYLENPQRPLYETYSPPYNYAWDIPVSYVTSKNSTSVEVEWLHKVNRSITLETALGPADWILGNYKQFGFYRMNYDAANWNALIEQLNTDHLVFDVINRGQLIQDSFNLGRSGDLEHVYSLRMTEYLSDETDYLPWFAAADHAFVYFTKIFRYSEDYTVFQSYARKLLEGPYAALGWDRRPGDTHHDIYLRDLVLTHACRHDNIHCFQTAMEYFRRWQHDPSNATIIPPDIRDAVYCTAIRHGLTSDWHFLFEQYKTFKHFSNEKYRRRKALACTLDRPILTKLFNMAAAMDEDIVSHDRNGPISIMRDIGRSSIGQYVAWEAVNMHWDSLPSKFTIMAAVCETFSTEYDLQKYESFISNHPPSSHVETDNYEDMRHLIMQNIRWRRANEDTMFKWLRTVI